MVRTYCILGGSYILHFRRLIFSICLCFRLSVSPPLYLSGCISICLCLSLSVRVCQCLCPSVCMSPCVCMSLSVCMSSFVYKSVCVRLPVLSVFLSVCLYGQCLFVCLSVCVYVCMFVCLYVSHSISLFKVPVIVILSLFPSLLRSV